MPEWLLKLSRRLAGLAPGRYIVIVTIGTEHDWTVQELGRVEK